MEKDPFEILGIQHGADPAIAAAAYKALSKKYHPDLNPGDPHAAERMKEINSAYTAIKAGDYKDEDYYHPERKAREQAYQQAQARQADSAGYQQPYGNYQSQTADYYPEDYQNTSGDYFHVPNRKRSRQRQEKGQKQGKQWYYNGIPMSRRKALFLWAWNKWLKWVLLVVALILALFIVYRVVTGGSLGNEVKKTKDDFSKSLTQSAQIQLEQPRVLSLPDSNLQVVFPNGELIRTGV